MFIQQALRVSVLSAHNLARRGLGSWGRRRGGRMGGERGIFLEEGPPPTLPIYPKMPRRKHACRTRKKHHFIVTTGSTCTPDFFY